MNTLQNTIEIADRRATRRQTSSKRAILWVNNRKAQIGVIEHTIDGARLMVRQLLKVGDVVELLVGDTMFARKARVAWTQPLSVSHSVIAGFCFLED